MKTDARRVYVFIAIGLLSAVFVGLGVWKISAPGPSMAKNQSESMTPVGHTESTQAKTTQTTTSSHTSKRAPKKSSVALQNDPYLAPNASLAPVLISALRRFIAQKISLRKAAPPRSNMAATATTARDKNLPITHSSEPAVHLNPQLLHPNRQRNLLYRARLLPIQQPLPKPHRIARCPTRTSARGVATLSHPPSSLLGLQSPRMIPPNRMEQRLLNLSQHLLLTQTAEPLTRHNPAWNRLTPMPRKNLPITHRRRALSRNPMNLPSSLRT